jgi:hypothetical protein
MTSFRKQQRTKLRLKFLKSHGSQTTAKSQEPHLKFPTCNQEINPLAFRSFPHASCAKKPTKTGGTRASPRKQEPTRARKLNELTKEVPRSNGRKRRSRGKLQGCSPCSWLTTRVATAHQRYHCSLVLVPTQLALSLSPREDGKWEEDKSKAKGVVTD